MTLADKAPQGTSVDTLLETLQGRGVELSLRRDTVHVSAPVGALSPALREALRLHRDQIARRLADQMDPVAALAASPAPRRAPLMPWQRGFWLMHLRPDSDPGVLHTSAALALKGPVHVDRLTAAVTTLADRHPMLRARFGHDEHGDPEQIDGETGPSLDRSQAAPEATEDGPQSLEAVARHQFTALRERRFDLGQEPPLRLHLVSAGQSDHRLLVVAHHIAIDGWSLGLILRDLMRFHDTGSFDDASTPSLSCFHYAPSADTLWKSASFKHRIDAEGARLSGLPLCQPLPTDRRRNHGAAPSPGCVSFTLTPACCGHLRTLAVDAKGSLPAVLLTCLHTLFLRLTGQGRLVTMVPVANRAASPALEQVVGCFANGVFAAPLLRPSMTVRQAVAHVTAHLSTLLDGQDVPMDDVIDAAGRPRLEGAYPGAQVVLAVQDGAVLPSSNILEITLSDLPPLGREDAFLEFRHTASGGLDGRLNFDGRLYTTETAKAMADAFINLAEACADHPTALLRSLPLQNGPGHTPAGPPEDTPTHRTPAPLSVADRILAERLAATAAPGTTAIWIGPVGLARLSALRAAERAGMRLLAVPETISATDATALIAQTGASVFLAAGDLDDQPAAGDERDADHTTGVAAPPSWAVGLRRLSPDRRALSDQPRPPHRLLLGLDGLVSLDPDAVDRRRQAARKAVALMQVSPGDRVVVALDSASDDATELLEALQDLGVTLCDPNKTPASVADVLLCTRSSGQKARQTITVNHGDPRFAAVLGTPDHGTLAWRPACPLETNGFTPATPLQPGLRVVSPDGTEIPADLPGLLGMPHDPETPVKALAVDAKIGGDDTLQIRVDPLGARSAWINGHLVDFDAVAARLVEVGGVADAALSVDDRAGGPTLVAWICQIGAGNHSTWMRAIHRASAGYASVDHGVRLVRLPRDVDGRLDRHRLSVMPLTAPTALAGSGDAHESVTVRVEPRSLDPSWAHVGDILPPAGHGGIYANPVFETPLSERASSSDAEGRGPALLEGPASDHSYPENGWTPVDWVSNAARQDRTLWTLDHDGQSSEAPFGDLLTRAARVATGLRTAGFGPGHVVVLTARRPADFLAAFYGATFAGITVAPVAPPRDWRAGDPGFDKIQHVIRLTGARAIIVNEAITAPDTDEGPLPTLRVDTLADAPAGEAPYQWRADETLLISFTSGSTGAPKGVPLRAENIWAQPLAFGPALGFEAGTTAFNFTSLDHVASLIGFCGSALSRGSHLAVVSVERFLADPEATVACLATWRAARSWAPDFVWAQIASLLHRLPAGSLDLSAVQAVYSAGECPLDATYAALKPALSRHGAHDVALMTSWGMAETTSLLTLSRAWDGQGGHLVHNGVIDSGAPIPGTAARIVDAAGKILQEGDVGLFEVRGQQVFQTYIVLDETGQTFRRSPLNADAWMETGDLAFIADGRIMLLGREKDVLVLNGQNVSQAAIENTIDGIDGVDPTYTSVIASRNARTGKTVLVVFFCPASEDLSGSSLVPVLKRISGAVATTYGVRPDYVLPVQRQDIAKTGLGKIQRTRLRKAFEAGVFSSISRRVDLLLRNERCVPWTPLRWTDAAVPSSRSLSLFPPRVLLLDESDGAAASLDRALHRLGAETLRSPAQEPEDDRVRAFLQRPTTIVEFVAWADATDVLARDALQRMRRARALVQTSAVPQRFVWVERGRPRAPRSLIGSVLAASLRQDVEDVTALSITVSSFVSEADADTLARTLLTTVGHQVRAVNVTPAGEARTPILVSSPRLAPATWASFPAAATVLVIGGTGAIGRVLLPQLLAWTDWRFIVVGRRDADTAGALLTPLAGALDRERVTYHQGDASDPATLRALLDGQPIDAPIAAVVNLAGRVERTPIETLTDTGLASSIQDRLRIVEALQSAFADRRRSIVHVTSINGDLGRHDFLAYSVANAAQKQWIARHASDTPRHVDLTCGQWLPPDGATDVELHLARLGFPLIDGRVGATAVIHALLGSERHLVIGLDPRGQEISPHAAPPPGPLDRLVARPTGPSLTNERVEALRRKAATLGARLHVEDKAGGDKRSALTASEKIIQALWASILDIDEAPDPDANFFDVGGTSLLAARLHLHLLNAFGITDDVLVVYRHTTIRAQARLISGAQPAAPPPSPDAPPPETGRSRPRTRSTMAHRRRSAR